MSIWAQETRVTGQLDERRQRALLAEAFARLDPPPRRVLALPPDHTRLHSGAGELTRLARELLGPGAEFHVMPALGTHTPMNREQRRQMFGDLPDEIFRVHDWRRDLTRLGEIPAAMIRELSEGKVDYPINVEINRLLVSGDYDLVLSIGQVVPHEVIGMANGNKNIFVGAGGQDTINRSHYLGAVYGMERMMGRSDTPVRRALDFAEERCLAGLPLLYVLTVVGREADGALAQRGLFIGQGRAPFAAAAELSRRVNITMLDEPLDKVVVYLDPVEFKSTWLGNKSVYRTRMALADGGELIVLAPGLKEFGEDAEIDRLIRRYGYRGTPATIAAVRDNPDLAANLSAAAHLIHGSSEDRFSITYAPGHLSREEIESVNFRWADLAELTRRYDPARLREGFNEVSGERIFYISNPALGLWSRRSLFA